jgi:poly(3-hydroxybutyrate) depolymerase
MNTFPSPASTAPFFRLCLCAFLFITPGAANITAQTSLEISQLRLRNNVLRRENKLDDATNADVRKLEEAALAEATAGQQGLAFRDLSKAVAIREGKPWSAQDEFVHSLVLATDTAICDPAHPLVARLTQRFPATRSSELKLNARAFLEPFQRPGAGQVAARNRAGKARALGDIPAFPPDLIFSPCRFAGDLNEVSDGPYLLAVELRDGEKTLQKITAPMFVVHGFDAKHAELERRLEKVDGFEPVKASVRYPFDFARVLNLGRIEPVFYDFAASVAHSEQLVAALESGKDPFAGEHGSLARHYFHATAGEIMPYRVFVPDAYDGSKAMPLIIALHGLGGTETSFMQGYGGALNKAAGEHGFLVAAPLGYRRNGGYGGPSPDPLTARMFELSEQDVMNVLKLVREQYKVDPSRIYLMGHSMGGFGTWKLGTKYPDIWAALAPIAGGGSPKLLPLQNLKDNHIPVLCVHGDADVVVPVDGSRILVAEMKRLGIEHEYIEVKGGTHGDVVGPNCARIVEYFSQHQRSPK